MINQEKDYFLQLINQQPAKKYRPIYAEEHKADMTLLLNLQIPLPPKKQQKPQKVHPYIKLANQMETKAKKVVQQIIDQRNRCKIYRDIYQQQEKKEAEKSRKMFPHNQQRQRKGKKRRIRQNSRKLNRGSSQDDTDARGPPYMPNIIKNEDLFPKKEQKAQKINNYSRSRSKYAQKVFATIKKQREKSLKQKQSKQQETNHRMEEQNDKMQEEKPAQLQNISPLQKLLSTQKSSQLNNKEQVHIQQKRTNGQMLKEPFSGKNPDVNKLANSLAQDLKSSQKASSKASKTSSQNKKVTQQLRDRIFSKTIKNIDQKGDLNDIQMKQQLIKKKQEQLRKQKEKLQQQKRIMKERKRLQQQKEQLQQRQRNLQKRERQIAEREASSKKKHRQNKRQQSQKRHKQQHHHSRRRKRSPSPSSSSSSNSDKPNWRKQLHKVTGYNPSDQKYRKRDRQRIIQSSFSRLHEEEKFSRKKGIQQQEDHMRLQKKMKRKHDNHY